MRLGMASNDTVSRSPHTGRVSWFRNPRQGAMRWLFWAHWGFGLTLGLYFAVVCLTGSLIVYKKELERAFIPQLVQVPAGPQRVSLDAMTTAVRQAYPAHRLSNVYLYHEPGVTTSFRLQGDDGRTQVYVNPYTAAIVGADRYEGAFLQWVYDLHVYLLMGKSGLVANAIGGFALFGMCLTGLVLWWPRGNRMAQGFAVNWKASWKRQVYDLHKVGGVLALLPLALLAITGAYWGFPDQYEAALGAITGGPGRVNAPVLQPEPTGDQAPSLDAMLQTAKQQIPEGQPTLLTFSSAPERPYTVRVRILGDWRTIGDHSVYFHSSDGRLLDTVRHESLPLGARLQRDIYALHFGTFGGHSTRVLWLLVGLAGTMLFATSLLMYGNRVLVKRWRQWASPKGAVPVHAIPDAASMPSPIQTLILEARAGGDNAHR